MAVTLLIQTSEELSAVARAAIIDLCAVAFGEPFDQLFALLPGSRHLLAYADEYLVSHACWVTRWLQPSGSPPLRTAYVEAVATHPDWQRRGLGTLVMRRLAEEIDAYDLGGLSPAVMPFYTRLEWEEWRGPTAIRTADGLLQTPDEEIMILRTPQTPPLELDAPITAEWREGDLW
ncbi:MAG TPA: GNAT family N-acetyltransferase [Thermomicrobiales bacterium]|jgi:aminoglycoside 2'-N-acetyltransferase I